MIFAHIAQDFTDSLNQQANRQRISNRDYESWQQEEIWHRIKGLRYGQSFCATFDIADNLLYRIRDRKLADDRIRALYVKPDNI